MSSVTWEIDVAPLRSAFTKLRSALTHPSAPAPRQFIPLTDLQSALTRLRSPLAVARAMGGGVNPWAITGVKNNEVRNAAALAGLWSIDFGGITSRNFLAKYLSGALQTVEWERELEAGYNVTAELCPMGDRSERVDLVIETSEHLVGIEIKIAAGLGEAQLERYVASIDRRGALSDRRAHVLLLAPFKSHLEAVGSTSWREIAKAAEDVVPRTRDQRTFVEHFIASFAAHVRNF